MLVPDLLELFSWIALGIGIVCLVTGLLHAIAWVVDRVLR